MIFVASFTMILSLYIFARCCSNAMMSISVVRFVSFSLSDSIFMTTVATNVIKRCPLSVTSFSILIGRILQLPLHSLKISSTRYNGSYTKELFISRRENSKSLAWSSVRIAYQSAVEKKGTVIAGPKELANVRGISYIYSLLWRFGVIKVPREVEDRMRGKK